ncbi:ATP-grasp domain-containing protein [bacterium]|nr:ATP-grasp domain-containing protein [bacterium]
MSKKVLIVGSGASAYTVAQVLSRDENLEIFVAPGNDAVREFATVVDIREHSVQELLEFVLENDISLTVVTSKSDRNDIANVFQANNQNIFCPTKASSAICDSKILGKKFMHQNSIPCPKFAVFDKPNFAYSYLESASFPVVIKTEYHQKKGIGICNNISSARSFIENAFDEKRILIEDYIWGHEFSFYVMTDGYQAIPLGCVATYKYELEGNGGMMSSGMGAFSDNYKISNKLKEKIMRQIVNPTLESLANSQKPYVGILGVDLIVDSQEKLYTVEFNSFLKSPDAQVVLELLDDNLYDLFESCAIGAFADDYARIKVKDEHAVSCVLCAGEKAEKIEGLDELDEDTFVAHNNTKKVDNHYETSAGRTLILTRKSKVLSRAIKDLYEEVDIVNYSGKKYRKDIGTII